MQLCNQNKDVFVPNKKKYHCKYRIFSKGEVSLTYRGFRKDWYTELWRQRQCTQCEENYEVSKHLQNTPWPNWTGSENSSGWSFWEYSSTACPPMCFICFNVMEQTLTCWEILGMNQTITPFTAFWPSSYLPTAVS